MRIRMLYFYEAIVLVIASSLMGIMVGMVVGYTMTIQESLILSKTLAVFFPWQQFVVIMIISFICAFLSTFGPTT
jgi:ABC-type antimicrobial peptide transport system permease subunit